MAWRGSSKSLLTMLAGDLSYFQVTADQTINSNNIPSYGLPITEPQLVFVMSTDLYIPSYKLPILTPCKPSYKLPFPGFNQPISRRPGTNILSSQVPKYLATIYIPPSCKCCRHSGMWGQGWWCARGEGWFWWTGTPCLSPSATPGEKQSCDGCLRTPNHSS